MVVGPRLTQGLVLGLDNNPKQAKDCLKQNEIDTDCCRGITYKFNADRMCGQLLNEYTNLKQTWQMEDGTCVSDNYIKLK